MSMSPSHQVLNFGPDHNSSQHNASLRPNGADHRTYTIAVGLLVMMYPILCKVKYETLHRIFAHRQFWIRFAFRIVANWIFAPLLLAFLPDGPGLRNGFIFIGLARCIAMVLFWTDFARGTRSIVPFLWLLTPSADGP
ncbi:arsenicals resistance, partial [Exophiala xenobiotica]